MASRRKATLDRLHHKVPTGADIAAFKQIMEQMKGKLKTDKTLHLISALNNAVAVAGAGFLVFPATRSSGGRSACRFWRGNLGDDLL